jgi:hypothetical protein
MCQAYLDMWLKSIFTTVQGTNTKTLLIWIRGFIHGQGAHTLQYKWTRVYVLSKQNRRAMSLTTCWSRMTVSSGVFCLVKLCNYGIRRNFLRLAAVCMPQHKLQFMFLELQMDCQMMRNNCYRFQNSTNQTELCNCFTWPPTSRVGGVHVTNNYGFWLGWLDLLTLSLYNYP